MKVMLRKEPNLGIEVEGVPFKKRVKGLFISCE